MGSTNQTGLAGEFAVLSQLLARGIDASLTLGNTKGVDILVSNPKSQKLYKIEVKSKKGFKSRGAKSQYGPSYGWRMNEKHEDIKDARLYYCFVMMGEDDKKFDFRFFVVPAKKVAAYVKKQHEWCCNHKQCEKVSTREFRLGTEPDFKYAFKTPLADDYKNNWDVFRK